MSYRDELEHYMDLWQAAEKTFPKTPKPQPKKQSFYGMQDLPEDMGDIGNDESEDWNDIYNRSLEIDPDEVGEPLITEEQLALAEGRKPRKKADEDGFGNDLANGPGKDVKFHPNPVHFASVGDDSKLRVTPNWTDGDELRELSRLKTLVHDLEAQVLSKEALKENAKSIKKKLDGIRRQCDSLSQKLIPDPRYDVS